MALSPLHPYASTAAASWSPKSPSPIAPAIVIAALAASVVSCSRGPAGHAGFTMPPVPVEVSEVRSQTMRNQFRALGSIEADESVQIVSELNALVKRLPFEEGSSIAQGALIAELDDREIAADAARAEAQTELARTSADRSEKLAEQNVISQGELDAARTGLKVAEANEESAKARLAKTRIRAPFGGVIGRRRVSPGAYLRSGDVITELARIDVMRVRFAAPERYLSDLKRGNAVDVTTPGLPHDHCTGRIRVVDPIIDPDTRTVQLIAQVANPAGTLKSGMSGNVAVTLSERAGALVIPDEAVFAEGTQNFVFVVNADSTVAKSAVQLGTRDSSRVEVLGGLVAGARVVRTGHQKLFPGAHVVPIPAEGEVSMTAPGGGDSGGASAAPASAKGGAGGKK